MDSSEDLITVAIEKNKKVNEETIKKLLKPMTVISWVLSAGICHPDCSRVATIIVRVINLAICTTIVVYGAIDFFFFEGVFKSDTFKIMYYTNKVSCYVSSYWCVIQELVQHKKWPILIKMIVKVDKRIISRHGNLEDISYNGLINKFQIFAVIITVLLGPFSLICHAVYYYNIRPEDLFTSDLLLYHTIAQSLAMNLFFDIIVLLIYSRLRKLNNGINKIQDLGSGNVVLEIRRIREIYNGICNLVRYVNKIYGVHLLLSTLNAFTMVVATLFRIYMGVVEGKNMFILINNIIWITYTVKVTLNCVICTFVRGESKKTGILIHKIILARISKCPRSCELYSMDITKPCDPETNLQREINNFSSQLHHSTMNFNACGFFIIDNKLLRSFIGVITTYLIIVVQFYVPQ
ncbi:hypothetical protein G9C98_001970, partial [Cotesia typhae]